MTESCQVTFIIPSYNQGRFIGACLDSIAAQRLPRETVEVLVIDGGSTDETAAVVQAHPLRPDWHSELDRGQAHAVNKGLARARGEVIAWINSDDTYHPDVFTRALRHFDDDPELLVLYGNADHTDASGAFVRPYGVEPWDYDRLLDRCILCQPATLFRRRLYDQCGGLNENFHVGVDLEYWLRIGRLTTPRHTDLLIASSRLWASTKSSLQQFEMQEEALRLGFLYGDRWSHRRAMGVAENYALLRHPRLLSRQPPRRWLLHLYRTAYLWRLRRRLRTVDREACWTAPLLAKPTAD